LPDIVLYTGYDKYIKCTDWERITYPANTVCGWTDTGSNTA